MVKPTTATDAIVSTNRFAILGSATCDNQNPGTLPRGGGAAGTKTTNALLSNQGAISKVAKVKDIRDSRVIPGLCLSSGAQGKFPRERSGSVKRKNSAEDLSNPKSARISTECPHLKVIDENKAMLTRTLDSIADYSGNEPVLADGIRNLTICMNNLNEILGVVMAERLVPGSSPEVQIFEEVNTASQQPETSKFSFSSAVMNNRKPLKQKPLGDTESWATAVSRNTKRAQQVKGSQIPPPSGAEALQVISDSHKEDPFVKAVKEAERSILVFNLDMGQLPIMNPATISKKVTLCLLDLVAAKSGQAKGTHTQDSRDLVDDITSQVVRMEFFGSKTAPCKFPGNSELNATFYTVPVKFVFKDRRTAQTAAELQRKHLDLNSITPYHKSLKAAMTQAIKRAKSANPGHHAKVNLDLNGKSLKCLIRTEGNPPGSWVPWGKNIPLPSEALDPGTKDITKVILPTSPNSPDIKGTGSSKNPGKSPGNETSTSWADESEMESEETEEAETVGAEKSSIPPGAVLQRLKSVSKQPPTPSDSAAFSGRSSMTLRTPPRLDKDKDGSSGSW
jgi:hypothetical protein